MKKTKEKLAAENEFLRRGGYAESTSRVLLAAFKYCTLAFGIWCFRDAIIAFAGKTSEANIAVKFLANLSISNITAWCFGIGGIVFGYKQRKLKGEVVESLQSRIQELERRFDPNRSSSGLTKTGNTNPKDVVS